MSDLPCENPNCKSYGSPHPNCRCYGDMAEGGEAGFCTKDRPHDKSCQYFSEGGEAAPDFIPDDQAPPDEATPVKTEAPDFIPDDQAPQDDAPDFIPDDQAPPDAGSFSLPTSVSDAASRMGGDGLFRTPEEHAPGERVTDEEFKAGRDKAEKAAAIGSLITGGGIVGLAGKAGAAAADAVGLGKIGSGIIKGALSNGMIQASNEVSKWMMGENPEHAVGAVLAATGLGGLFGGVGGYVSTKLEEMAGNKLATKFQSFLTGVGHRAMSGNAAPPAMPEGLNKSAYEMGKKYFKYASGVGQFSDLSGAAYHGYKKNGAEGALTDVAKTAAFNKAMGVGAKFAAPVVLKILSSGTTQGLVGALDHYGEAMSGANKLEKFVDGLFGSGAKSSSAAINYLEPDAKRQKIIDWVDGGGTNQEIKNMQQDSNQEGVQGFAKGGTVEVDPSANGVALHFPEQNMLMSAAKGRASNYLGSLKPAKNSPKLSFDAEPDTREQQKTFDKAVDIAHRPLSVLSHIENGTIEPDHIKHLNSMFPEVTGLIQKKVMDGIVKAQMDGRKPSYKVRQGLSLLMGAPLSGEMVPANIQAAQAVFAPKGGPSGSGSAPGAAKKTSAPLSKSDQSYLTGDQAREMREQRRS